MRPCLTELVTKVKPNINSVEVHAQLSNNRHPVDGALVGGGSPWPMPAFTVHDNQCTQAGYHIN